MMNPKKVVKSAIDFTGPEWTPYQVSIPLKQLRDACAPAEIDEAEKALRDAGAAEVNGHFTAQQLFVNVNPDPTILPQPFRPMGEEEWVDEWGVIWTCREFPRVSGHPLEESWDLLDAYVLPDPCAPKRYERSAREVGDSPDRYRLGHVWFTLFERLWFLRGFNNMLMDPYIYPEGFARLRDLIVEFNLASIQRQVDLGVDGIFFSDDWGTQSNLLMNPDDWRKWYKPQYERMFDAVHAGGAHVWMHLCGNVMAIIPDLIEVGLDVLNPVQPQAMDVDVLASRFGGQLCFFGGFDVQKTLPFGTKSDVEDEVRHLMDIFGGYGGGYVGGTSHTILPDTPVENIVTLFEACKKYSSLSR
jgi:uroporphyrinogen decarboxylase